MTTRTDSQDSANLLAAQCMGGLFDALVAGGSPQQEAARRLTRVAFSLFVGGVQEVETAEFDDPARAALLACRQLDWSRVSPVIFGGLLQGVMDDDERRQAGAHYTSEENILKVVDSLFLQRLSEELDGILTGGRGGSRSKLIAFHDRLAALRFLDPACGCGNFLMVAYRELRALETRVLVALHGDQQAIDIALLRRVHVTSFHGIELEAFPADIARVVLLVMDHQCNQALSKRFGRDAIRVPLGDEPSIVCGNALEMDWADVLPAGDHVLVLGNPPFVGRKYRTAAQTAEVRRAFGGARGVGNLDYACAWYAKCAQYMRGTGLRAAFVSLNSIGQGEQPDLLWGSLPGALSIDFCWRSFPWRSEAARPAHVHVVVIGFSMNDAVPRWIYDEDGATRVESISPYLVAGPKVTVGRRAAPLCDSPVAAFGNAALDGGHLRLSAEEHAEFCAAYPGDRDLVRAHVGGRDMLHAERRYCLWLGGVDPERLRSNPMIVARLEATRSYRARSKRAATGSLAATPAVFGENRQPREQYIAIPQASSELRRYIPIALCPASTIANATVITVTPASPYAFGVLTSRMHNAWLRRVAGRLKSDIRYSVKIVYNNFPWPPSTTQQREQIERLAQAVLEARDGHPDRSLAQLYEPQDTPADLAAAHAALDVAVERAYRRAKFRTDDERVGYLLDRYVELTSALSQQ